jgi:hypothetical protein
MLGCATPRVALPLIAALGLLPAGGCQLLMGEPAADVANPKRFTGHGLAFDYPGNWSQTSETEVIEGIEMATITTESPGSSLAIVQQFRPSVPIGLDDVLDDFTQGMRESLSEEMGGVVGMTDRSDSAVEHALLGSPREGRRKQYTLELLGEKADHTVDMYAAELDDRAVIVYVQAADEDLEKATPGFELVMGSLATE